MFLLGFNARTVIFNRDIKMRARSLRTNQDMTLLAAVEPVLHGVGDQFGQYQGQRGRILRGHKPERTVEIDVDTLVAHGGQIDAHLQQLRNHFIEVDHLVRGLAEAFVDHGDGLHTALRLRKFLLDLLRLGLARLQPEQRRDGLQIVLHPVMDFGDRRVFGLQFNVPTAQLGDITAQHDGARPAVGVVQRQRPHGHRGTIGFKLGIDRRLAAQNQRQAFRECVVRMQQLRTDLAQILALHGGQRAETAEAAHRVGRSVSHDTIDGEDDEPVGDTGVVPLVHHRVMIRELPARNHLVQLFAGVDAFGLITAVGFTRRHIGLAHNQAQGLALVADRSVHIAHRRFADAAHHGRAENRRRAHRCVQLAVEFTVDFLADNILAAQGHHRGWTALVGDDIAAVRHR